MLRKGITYGLSVMILFLGMPHISYGNPTSEYQTIDKLYAQSAVLMDADSGRILYGKNENEALANASTTKILTCILALEEGEERSLVSISKEAESQPKVHLGVQVGEMYQLKDLLHSLMLESHNDSAVAIAEHIAGNVKSFSALMNEKAKAIGCENSYFITPNGLDASDANGTHHTTATDLAKIMKYCIITSPEKEMFLEITRTKTYSFQDLDGKRSFTCSNRNALLNTLEGALSGKTGFTNDAGYCYVGAFGREGKTLIVSLLACGWPNNKNYKWSDSKKLFRYGVEEYGTISFLDFPKRSSEQRIGVTSGTVKEISTDISENRIESEKILIHHKEQYLVKEEIIDMVRAPVEKGTIVGTRNYYIQNQVVKMVPIVTEKKVKKRWLPFS